MSGKREERNKGIEIRAHHGLCIAFFRGKGYSEDFTRHMAEVIGRLGPETEILLTEREDDICSACPNMTERGCSEKEKAEAFDRRVLELCGFAGERGRQKAAGGRSERSIPWGIFRRAVEEKITGCGMRREVCGECEWDEVCERIASETDRSGRQGQDPHPSSSAYHPDF